MTEWTDGYRAALADVETLARSRRLVGPAWELFFADLQQDALVIEREHNNRLQRRRLAAAREALPLFADTEK